MKLKNVFFTAALIVSSASLVTAADFDKSTSLSTKIQREISKMDLDFAKLDGQTITIRFTVNEKNEIIVLSTDNANLDTDLKAALNYDTIDASEFKPYEIYVLPVVFEKK